MFLLFMRKQLSSLQERGAVAFGFIEKFSNLAENVHEVLTQSDQFVCPVDNACATLANVLAHVRQGLEIRTHAPREKRRRRGYLSSAQYEDSPIAPGRLRFERVARTQTILRLTHLMDHQNSSVGVEFASLPGHRATIITLIIS